jgi:hypothetical protein
MNPYLEHPILWEPVHTRLAVEIADQIQPLLEPRYVTSVEERVYLQRSQSRKPDVRIEEARSESKASATSAIAVHGDMAVIVEMLELEFKEHRVEILDSYNEMKLVAAIELVSPSNKRSGPGRQSYLKKQKQLLARNCHLIEIDLIRNGTHVMSIPSWRLEEVEPYDYLICISRWPLRHKFELYPRGLRDPLPIVRIPLVAPDADVPLNLQSAIEEVYHRARFGARIRYDKPCVPALPTDDQAWVYKCLEKAGIREAEKKARGRNGRKKKG